MEIKKRTLSQPKLSTSVLRTNSNQNTPSQPSPLGRSFVLTASPRQTPSSGGSHPAWSCTGAPGTPALSGAGLSPITGMWVPRPGTLPGLQGWDTGWHSLLASRNPGPGASWSRSWIQSTMFNRFWHIYPPLTQPVNFWPLHIFDLRNTQWQWAPQFSFILV